ncbi:DUF3558 family protein [Corynebacterium sp. MSK158]|uniref:DUF3558 family protein n=1 Tax=Corynebacterium sp. MSK158 TaxID=3050212 RepID=UPI00254A0212|nr:DUF3558 family protein [Corynebacterium sp. MSK158]MDK8692658.1 DUF3558 family protein [Corynebacterium sp. MSK158]
MHAVYWNGKYEVKSSLFHSSCSSRQEVSARRIVVKRQVTVATLMVSTVMLSSCVADIGTRSASEETTKVDESGGISSADGAGGTNGDLGDDAEGNQGESADTNGGKNADGAGQPGEAGATGSEDISGVLPPLGEFDPADPSFELFDPCTEIPREHLRAFGLGDQIEDSGQQSGFSFCAFDSVEGTGGAVIGLTTSRQSFDGAEVQIASLSDGGGHSVPIVQIESELFGDMFCTVGVSTSRGILKVSHSGKRAVDDYEAKCSHAEKLLNKFY